MCTEFWQKKWPKSEWAKSEQAKSEQAKSEQAKSEQLKFPQITASSMELFFSKMAAEECSCWRVRYSHFHVCFRLGFQSFAACFLTVCGEMQILNLEPVISSSTYQSRSVGRSTIFDRTVEWWLCRCRVTVLSPGATNRGSGILFKEPRPPHPPPNLLFDSCNVQLFSPDNNSQLEYFQAWESAQISRVTWFFYPPPPPGKK